jgi:uncharacterized membrane protein
MLTAILLPVLLVVTSMAVDLGRQRELRRNMQAKADVIALDLSRYLDGSSANALRSSPTAAQAKIQSANRNGIDPAKVTVDWGNLTIGSNKFVSGTTAGATAVKVTTTGSQRRFFQQVTDGHATRSAVAAATAIAGFEIGSKFASIDTAQSVALNGVLNSIFKNAFGGSPALNLQAISYNGLVGTSVGLRDLATQLGFGSPSQLASGTVDYKQFLLAGATVLQHQGNTAAASVFNQVAAQTKAGVNLPVSKLMTVEAGGDKAALGAGVDAFNLLTGSAYAINGSNTITVQNVNLEVPNVAATTLTMTVTEGPRIKFGRVGATITTAQVKVTIAPTINLPLQLLGLPLLSVTGSIPLSETAAGATGTLTNIQCGAQKSITVGATPEPVTLSGVTLALSVKLLSGLNVATVNLNTGPVALHGSSNGDTFDYANEFLPPVGNGTLTPAPSTSLGIASALTLTNTNVSINALGLGTGLTLGNLVPGLNGVLGTTLNQLDAAITGPLAHALGVDIGGADLGAVNMDCATPILAG